MGRKGLKKYAELWDKVKNVIRSIANTSGDCDEKYMKIKSNSDDNLSLDKLLKLYNLAIIVRSVFQEDEKYYLQVFLDECL